MAIGHIGKTVVFETSDRKILNFTKMQRTVKGRWASHSRIGKKPKKQFLGPDADQLTFSITLNAEHGVRPRTILNKGEVVKITCDITLEEYL